MWHTRQSESSIRTRHVQREWLFGGHLLQQQLSALLLLDQMHPSPRHRGRQCDKTTSEMRGLSPKIISGDSQRSENAQTHTYKHTVSYMKFKLKLLQFKCHVYSLHKIKHKICFKGYSEFLQKRLSLTIGTHSSR
jgi:hypothetical protein